jgi:hypothetical protein
MKLLNAWALIAILVLYIMSYMDSSMAHLVILAVASLEFNISPGVDNV